MIEPDSPTSRGVRRRPKRTKGARTLAYHSSDVDLGPDDEGGAGVREPRRPGPVIGPQQAEFADEDAATT
ncbi:hypothetical protein [Nakamurella leprariae]|uniref:Uncharacterized protein n=1 Tax=Nakamurella leprariae TaxID=2803911 RepID=A0A939BXD0_9ACTN|nr:hypothetical protein [Nakamurella leprariae]MBM9465850.1 hypothetical protein [Nakamurella leprariae]